MAKCISSRQPLTLPLREPLKCARILELSALNSVDIQIVYILNNICHKVSTEPLSLTFDVAKKANNLLTELDSINCDIISTDSFIFIIVVAVITGLPLLYQQ